MTGRVTVSRELLRQVLRLFDKALDKDNVFGKLHNDAMDCMNDIQVALAEPAPAKAPVAEIFQRMHAEGHVWITTIAAAKLAIANTAPQAQQPAEVPLLTIGELADLTEPWAHIRSDYSIGIARATEKAVRQKAGLA